MDYRDNRQRWAESHQVVHFYAGQWCTFTPALTGDRWIKDKSEQETTSDQDRYEREPAPVSGSHPPPEEYRASEGSGAKQQRSGYLQSSRGPGGFNRRHTNNDSGHTTQRNETHCSEVEQARIPPLGIESEAHDRRDQAQVENRQRNGPTLRQTDEYEQRNYESEESCISPVHFDPRASRPLGLNIRTRIRIPKETANL